MEEIGKAPILTRPKRAALTMNKLLPCPFCGEERLNICATYYEPEDREAFAVTCRTRDCHGVTFTLGYGLFESKKKAIAAWNTRAKEKT